MLLPRGSVGRGALLVVLTAIVLGLRVQQAQLNLDQLEAAAASFLPPSASVYVSQARHTLEAVIDAVVGRSRADTCGWLDNRGEFYVVSTRVVTPEGVISAAGERRTQFFCLRSASLRTLG